MSGKEYWMTDKETGEVIPTFTILTTEADELMTRIHNSKKRMPVILTEHEEMLWLQGADISKPVELIAQIV